MSLETERTVAEWTSLRLCSQDMAATDFTHPRQTAHTTEGLVGAGGLELSSGILPQVGGDLCSLISHRHHGALRFLLAQRLSQGPRHAVMLGALQMPSVPEGFQRGTRGGWVGPERSGPHRNVGPAAAP